MKSDGGNGQSRMASLSQVGYMIEMKYKDKNGEDVKDVQYIELIDEKSNQLDSPEIFMDSNQKLVLLNQVKKI